MLQRRLLPRCRAAASAAASAAAAIAALGVPVAPAAALAPRRRFGGASSSSSSASAPAEGARSCGGAGGRGGAPNAASLVAAAAAAAAAAALAAGGVGRCEQEPKGAAEVLPGKRDHYGGIILDPAGLPACADTFQALLDRSLENWRSEGVRGIWMQVPLAKSHLISLAVDRGFTFHHAEREHCVMTAWLPEMPCPLPPNPSHQVGVGALCVNEEGKVLLVQEAVGPAAKRDIWKIPTGLLNAREDIKDGVERELFEETGMRGSFEKVLAFRHGHMAPWGKSDLFFICLVRVAGAGGDFVLQENEIAMAKWTDFQEFLDQAPYPRDTPVWAKAYGSCVGPDGVVGNVPGIRVASCSRSAKGKKQECVYY